MTGTSRISRWHSIVVAFSMIATLVVITPHQVARAVTLTVDNSTGSGCDDVVGTPYCTIGAAVANANAAGDTIQVAPGTYNEILSVAAKQVTISGQSDGFVLNAQGASTGLTLADGASVYLLNATISNGSAEIGGGILVTGGSRLDLQDSVVTGNQAFEGGGIAAEASSLLSVVTSRIVDNQAEVSGGGVHIAAGASLAEFFDTEIAGNVALSEGTTSGGGVYALSPFSMLRTTISGNSAVDGGGIWFGGPGATTATIQTSTLHDNLAAARGGGILVSADELSVQDSTLTGNRASTAGNLVAVPNDAGAISFSRSILAENVVTDGGDASDCEGFGISTDGYNFLDGTDACSFTATATDVVDPGGANLGPLGDNGGSTPTRLPLTGSPVIDGVIPGGCPTDGVRSVDQRAVARPQGQGCEIGSVELPTLSIADITVTEGSDGTTVFSVDSRVVLSLSTASPSDVLVDLARQDGTATGGNAQAPGVDYVRTNGTVTIPAGSTEATTGVGIVGDTDVESDETFQIVLSNSVGAVIADNTADGLILDDDEGLPPGTIDQDLVLLGTATRPDGRLRLQPSSGGTGGGFWTTPVRLDVNWSTSFTFQITEPIAWEGAPLEASADGLTFVMSSGIPTVLGTGGGGLGIAGLEENYVAVELDTFDGTAGGNVGVSIDPPEGVGDGNHVGIDLGNLDTDGVPISEAWTQLPEPFDNGELRYVWVDYDAGDPIEGQDPELQVSVSSTGTKPTTPTVQYELSLPLEVTDVGYLGFTSATGAARAVHDIVDWDLSGVTPAAGTVLVTDITTDASTVEAGYAVPLTDIPAERLLVGADSVAGAPLGAIGDLSSSPLGAIPLGAIPLGAIGGSSALGQTLLSEIPIAGGWEPLLAGTVFAGRPLQTLTLDQVSGALDPVELAALGLGDIRIGDSALADLSIAALTLGDVPLNEMGLSGDDSVLDIETSGGSIATVPLGAIQLGAIPLGAIGTPPTGAPLGAIPLGAIQLGAIPLGAIDSPAGSPLGAIGDLAAAPLGAISPDGAPLGAIPLGAIQLGAIPLGAIQLGAIQLGAIGGGCAVFGCPTGITDDSTVSEYLDATGSDLDASPLGAIPLGAIQLGAIQLGAIDVATLPLGAIPLGAITTATPLGAIQLGAIGADVAATCAAVGGTCDAGTLLADYAAALPAGTENLASTPLGAIQLGAIPLGAIEFTATGLNGVPLGAISIAGLPLGAIEIDSIDLVSSPLGAIQLGAIPLGAICGSSDPSLTLVEAAALGSCGGATLDDLGAALDGYELSAVLDHLTFGFLGQLVELDDLTYGEIVVSILLSIDFPWEDLPLDEIETRDIACGFDRTTGGCTVGAAATRPDIVVVDVDVDVDGGAAGGDLISVTIPDGWAYLPDSATSIYSDGETNAAVVLSDPVEVEGTLTFAGTLPPGPSTIRFAVAPDFEVRSGFTVSADVVGGESPIASAPIAVVEGLEFGNAVGSAEQVAADTLYVGYIRQSGDQDWWDIPAPAPGFRVAVYLSNLAGDVDTFVYRPETTPLGVDTNSRSIPLGTVPISDDEFDFDGTDTQSPEVLGDSVIDAPTDQVLGDSSTNRGTEDEYSEFFSRGRDAGGDYNIQVAGFQGATSESPYVLRVKYKAEVPTPTCSPRTGLGVDTGPLPAIPEDVDTIFLVNWDRMEAVYGPLGSLPADLTAFASSTVGGVAVNGVVIPIGSIPGVGAGFTAWDANPCDPDAANVIVDNIVSYIQGVADAHPSLRHVTVVGSDEVVPFARLEDETIVANESTYTEGFADNALYGSQFTRHYLSDAPYGDLDPVQWLDRFAYLPDLGVGRLVETPAQIAAAITTFQANGGLLDPQTAATAGYDFLADGAGEVKDALSGLTDLDSATARLLTETWTRQELADIAFGASSGPAADVISPNAHYDHYRALPAIGNLNQAEDDLFTIDDVNGLGSTDLASRIIFTVGCHSALNVPNLATNDQDEDWAEVYGDYRAIYIGNTGYGYGDTATVALSEQVMANLAFNLGNGQTIGQNLSQAKQDQFGKAGLYGVYDLKAIEEATLYGLPIWRVDVEGAQPITSNGSDTGAVETEPSTGLLAAPFSKSPVFESDSESGDGTFWTADGGTQFLHWRPIQPKTEIDATQDGLVATGVVLTDLETTDVPLGDPVYARPNTSDFSGREPEIEFRDSIFPTSFASVGSSDLLNPERTGGPTRLQQRVNLLAGQYVGPLGIQRLFDQIDGTVYYADDPSGVDWTAPVITTVDADVVGNQVTFLVEANDPDSNVSRVVALYRSSAVSTTSGWTSIDLIPVGGDMWAGGGAFDTSLTPPLDYIVQVVNRDGVVAVSTFKGEFHKAAVVPVGGNNPPTVGEIAGPTGPIELGTTAAFSASVSDDGPTPLTAVWDFGDGTTASSSVAGGETSVSHVYATPGVYRVQLVVVDGAGAVGQAVFEFAVVYDPDGGFVTGGGWIDSPPGAYPADPSLTGKANFGFVSKYKKGQSTPDGNTTFQFKTADLKFKSTSYDWMVIAGKKAQYKGSGTINGSGDYGFMITAIDAALTPSTDVDLFRIKIWDKGATGGVIYDNQLGASDDADPTTAIGGGSIVIHEPPRGRNR